MFLNSPGLSPPALAHDAGALFREDDGRELLYFGRVGQMMADFIPQMLLELGLEGRKM